MGRSCPMLHIFLPFNENRRCDFAGTQCGWYFVGRMRCDNGNVKEGGLDVVAIRSSVSDECGCACGRCYLCGFVFCLCGL